jgi:hypothetical protein
MAKNVVGVKILFPDGASSASIAIQTGRISPWQPDEAKLITKTVKGYFESHTKSTMDLAEKFYPKTVRQLFYLAFQVHQGFFGENLREKLMIDQKFQVDISPFHLLLIRLGKQKVLALQAYPEIFKKIIRDPRWIQLKQALSSLGVHDIEQILLSKDLAPPLALCKHLVQDLSALIECGSQGIKGLQLLFEHFIDHFLNPSSLLIEWLLRMKLKQQAALEVERIKNPVERSHARFLLAELLIKQQNFAKVMELRQKLSPEEKDKITEELIEKMIRSEQPHVAIQFLSKIEDPQEKNENFKHCCLLLARYHYLSESLQLADKIEETSIRDYVRSNIVNILSLQNQLDRAKEIIPLIDDPGFKEDAITSVVKAFMHIKDLPGAIQFVSTLSDPALRKSGAKVIETILKSLHQEEELKKLRKVLPMLV